MYLTLWFDCDMSDQVLGITHHTVIQNWITIIAAPKNGPNLSQSQHLWTHFLSIKTQINMITLNGEKPNYKTLIKYKCELVRKCQNGQILCRIPTIPDCPLRAEQHPLQPCNHAK